MRIENGLIENLVDAMRPSTFRFLAGELQLRDPSRGR